MQDRAHTQTAEYRMVRRKLEWRISSYGEVRHLHAPFLGDTFTEASERQIDDLDPLVAVDDAFAPDWVEIGEGLFRDGFQGGFSLRLQFLNAIARSDEHVTGFPQVRFVAGNCSDPLLAARSHTGGTRGAVAEHSGDWADYGADVGIGNR